MRVVHEVHGHDLILKIEMTFNKIYIIITYLLYFYIFVWNFTRKYWLITCNIRVFNKKVGNLEQQGIVLIFICNMHVGTVYYTDTKYSWMDVWFWRMLGSSTGLPRRVSGYQVKLSAQRHQRWQTPYRMWTCKKMWDILNHII